METYELNQLNEEQHDWRCSQTRGGRYFQVKEAKLGEWVLFHFFQNESDNMKLF